MTTSAPSRNDNLLKNGDFTELDHFWTLDNAALKVAEVIRGELKVAQSGSATQVIELLPGTEYMIAGRSKVVTPGGVIHLTSTAGVASQPLPSTNFWFGYGFGYTTAPGVTTVSLTLSGGNGETWFDDMEVYLMPKSSTGQVFANTLPSDPSSPPVWLTPNQQP